ncbi:MAG: molybdopterin molybdotransferase MoeA [Chitinophagales bacterium]
MNKQENIISVKEAVEIIQSQVEDFGEYIEGSFDSLHKILAQNIVADRDFPAYDNVRMDGIALKLESIQKGVKTFKIQGIQAAGSPAMLLENELNCIEVMTGSILPKNTDIVIQYEWISIKNGTATLNFEAFDKQQLSYFKNIQAKGFDKKAGSELIKKGTRISSAEIGILATVGTQNLVVKDQPKIIIISTGDELVAVSETPKSYQIRRSNVFALQAILQENGFESSTDHIADNKIVLKEKIASHLKNYDVLLFSGAVSKGKFDFLPEILQELGVKKLFHKVKQRPGKPFWFGKKEKKTVFAFPGNPVSTYVGCLKYFLPWVNKSLGIDNKTKTAILAEDFDFKPKLYYFLSVSIEEKNGQRYAIPQKGKGSGDLANLANADGFLELPAERTNFKKGEEFPIILFRK